MDILHGKQGCVYIFLNEIGSWVLKMLPESENLTDNSLAYKWHQNDN